MKIEDQPPPLAQPDHVPVWDLVIEDARRMFESPASETTTQLLAEMRERDTTGRARYGVPLTTHNGRDHLVDAYQEALDLAVYLRAEIEERGANYVLVGTHTVYHAHLQNLHHLRCLIADRKEQSK